MLASAARVFIIIALVAALAQHLLPIIVLFVLLTCIIKF
jgi:hypothetical protein